MNSNRENKERRKVLTFSDISPVLKNRYGTGTGTGTRTTKLNDLSHSKDEEIRINKARTHSPTRKRNIYISSHSKKDNDEEKDQSLGLTYNSNKRPNFAIQRTKYKNELLQKKQDADGNNENDNKRQKKITNEQIDSDELDFLSLDMDSYKKTLDSLNFSLLEDNKKSNKTDTMSSKISSMFDDKNLEEISKEKIDDSQSILSHNSDHANFDLSNEDFFDDTKQREHLRAMNTFKPKCSYVTFEALAEKFEKNKSKLLKMIRLNESTLDLQSSKNLVEYKFLIESIENYQNSKRSTITQAEVLNLDKKKYFGYLGNKRSNYLSQLISNEFEAELKAKLKSSKFLQFWTIINYNLYVLTPQLISWIIIEDEHLEKHSQVYKFMEDTSAYGLLLMDEQDLKKQKDLTEVDKNLYRSKQRQKLI